MTEVQSIRRGSAMNTSFSLPTDITGIAKVKAIFAQRERIIAKECTYSEERGAYTAFLGQNDTLFFEAGDVIQIQLKILLSSGDVLVSDVMEAECTKGLSSEVI